MSNGQTKKKKKKNTQSYSQTGRQTHGQTNLSFLRPQNKQERCQKGQKHTPVDGQSNAWTDKKPKLCEASRGAGIVSNGQTHTQSYGWTDKRMYRQTKIFLGFKRSRKGDKRTETQTYARTDTRMDRQTKVVLSLKRSMKGVKRTYRHTVIRADRQTRVV